MTAKKTYEAIVMGASAGGLEALMRVLAPLPTDFSLPIIIVMHIHRHSHEGFLIQGLSQRCRLKVKEADEKEKPEAGYVYLAPANYHLLIEKDKSFSLSIEEKVHYCRPAIDILFDSAAEAFGRKLIGVILTGANSDGAAGLKKIKACGGFTIVQDPKIAEASTMPLAAIAAAQPDWVLALPDIAKLLGSCSREGLTG